MDGPSQVSACQGVFEWRASRKKWIINGVGGCFKLVVTVG